MFDNKIIFHFKLLIEEPVGNQLWSQLGVIAIADRVGLVVVDVIALCMETEWLDKLPTRDSTTAVSQAAKKHDAATFRLEAVALENARSLTECRLHEAVHHLSSPQTGLPVGRRRVCYTA